MENRLTSSFICKGLECPAFLFIYLFIYLGSSSTPKLEHVKPYSCGSGNFLWSTHSWLF